MFPNIKNKRTPSKVICADVVVFQVSSNWIIHVYPISIVLWMCYRIYMKSESGYNKVNEKKGILVTLVSKILVTRCE